MSEKISGYVVINRNDDKYIVSFDNKSGKMKYHKMKRPNKPAPKIPSSPRPKILPPKVPSSPRPKMPLPNDIKSENDLMKQIQSGVKLKNIVPIPKKQIDTDTPLMKEIKQGIKLNKIDVKSNNSNKKPTLQSHLEEQILKRRQFIQDDYDEEDNTEWTGGKKKENYITCSTEIGKKISKKYGLEYKPIVLQKCISIIRKKYCKSNNTITSLIEAEKWMNNNKKEFISLFNSTKKSMNK